MPLPNIPAIVALALGSVIVAAPNPAGATLLVADFEKAVATNLLGGTTSTYADPSTQVTPPQGAFATAPGYNSTYAAHMGFTLGTSTAYPYAEILTYLLPGLSSAGIDLSAYSGVRFYARGSGTYLCQLPTSKTATEFNHYSATITAVPAWAPVQLSFKSFAQTWGTPQPWDPTTIYAVAWETSAGQGATGEIDIDNVEFYRAEEAWPEPDAGPSAVIEAPKVNQIGYLPGAVKWFHVATGSKVHAGDPFQVEDLDHHTVAYSGVLSSRAFDDTASTGEQVLTGDLSAVSAPGNYTITAGGLASPQFQVGGDVYRPVFRAALRAFSVLRCGVAVNDDETGIQHAACHTKDAILRDDPTKSLDLTGGWHNAGDYGKWTHEAAISVSHMLWAYELSPDGAGAINTGTADSQNNVPDILDEARFGLTWLLKMQQPDGSVFHKVDTEPNFAWGTPPESDPNVRRAGLPSTIDAADFAAVMAQAARVFGPFDQSFADTCLAASKRAFAWAQANPAVGQTDVYYTDPDPSQELLWALGEMVRTTHDPALTTQLSAALGPASLGAVTWLNPGLLGVVTTAFDTAGAADVKATATNKIRALCDSLVAASGTSGYGVVTGASEYWWESNETLLGRANALLLGSRILGTTEYRDVGLHQLDWFFGDNSLNQCFVTGFGQQPVARPYHWTYNDYHKILPGWAAGGPNGQPAGADPPLASLIHQGTPPAKCYLDLCAPNGSYASNEGETVENAALVLATGLLVERPQVGDAGAARVDAGAGRVDAGATSTPPHPKGGGCGCRMASEGAGRWLGATAGLLWLVLWGTRAGGRGRSPPTSAPVTDALTSRINH